MREESRNIVICGHSKHGKSTLTCRLLLATGAVTQEAVDKNWRQFQTRSEFIANSNDYNRLQAFMHSRRRPTFGSDQQPDDRSRTVQPVRASGADFTLIDNPGHHERYLDNTIYGLYLADYAIIVVDARKGVEEGTELAAGLIGGLKLPLLGVCVTKMDSVNYSKEIYDSIKTQVEQCLNERIRPHLGRVPIIPVSALYGFGFMKEAADDPLSWYRDESMADILAGAERMDCRYRDDILRITIEGPGEFHLPAGVGPVVVGCVESGTVRTGDTLVFTPAPDKEPRSVRVRSIRRLRSDIQPSKDSSVEVAARALVTLAVTTDASVANLKRNLRGGTVLTHDGEHATVAAGIVAQLVFFDRETLYSDKEFLLNIHGQRVPCKIASLEERHKLGVGARAYPGFRSIAKLNFQFPICIEPVARIPRLGRFVLRSQGRVVGCGSCLATSSGQYQRLLLKPGTIDSAAVAS